MKILMQVLHNLRTFLNEEEKRLQEADSVYRQRHPMSPHESIEHTAISGAKRYDIKEIGDSQSGCVHFY